MRQVPDLPIEKSSIFAALDKVAFYRRRLPHWQPEGVPIFLTWRLHGSLPAQSIRGPSGITEGQRFAIADREMDLAATGPTWLKVPEVARAVADVFFLFASKWQIYDLFNWVIMSNHVHLLLQPLKP